MYDNLTKVINVDVDEILPNRFQPRIQFDEEEILELSESIREHGVIQPIVVRPIGDKYEIIAGERRYKANVLAGKETIPVIIKNLSDKESAEIALIENVQRKNLTPIEEALSYKKILDMGYLTQEQLASKIGKSQPTVANKIRLLNLSDKVQEALLENRISERHARSLLKIEKESEQDKMLERIVNERLTVRKTDEEIKKIQEKENNSKEERKGELSMNNEILQPTAPTLEPMQPQTNVTQFDIFAESTPAPVVPETPVIPEIPEIPETPVAPVVPETPVIPEIPEIPATPVAPVVPETPVIPEIPATPVAQVVPETPVIPEITPQPANNNLNIQFDQNGNVISDASQSTASDIPELQPIVEQPLPNIEMQPISDEQMTQTDENTFSFGTAEAQPVTEVAPAAPTPEIPEFKLPDPIIVTDYSKQYDPVMPEVAPAAPTQKVEFKEVINAIRECSSKIEQYGFKIDVEEYDLANLYQVIFKIEK